MHVPCAVRSAHNSLTITTWRFADAVQGLRKVGSEPASIDAALTWLQHCHRFNLSHAVSVCKCVSQEPDGVTFECRRLTI